MFNITMKHGKILIYFCQAHGIFMELRNKLSEDWSATLSDVWDEIDHVNQITSWDPREHLSDYHGLDDNEESCSCFSDASDAITREVIRLLLHQCSKSDSLWIGGSEEKVPSGPPTKRRRIV